ncbi:MAG TPA: ribosome recycling factor [Opitutales bacterium]|nr:ribosome recycling factor [Opitutales bacterium]
MDPKKTLTDARAAMAKAVEHTLHEFSSLHTGKASPVMVESVLVQAYGSTVRLKEVAAITTPDARTIQIQPWDKGVLRDVEKALQVAKLGFNPLVQGDIIRCPLPELSRERRQELAKVCHTHAEEGRVRIRTIRREANDALKKAKSAGAITEDDLKRYEKDVQTEHDKFIADVNKHLAAKEAELMKV